MLNQSRIIRVKRITLVYLAALLIALAVATPAFADYMGPNRTVDETTSVCKVLLNECQYVAAKGDYLYHKIDDWSCSNESKPWRAYPSQPSQDCSDNNIGDKYWERDEIIQGVTTTYPPAVINSSLQNCTLQNGWCATAPTLFLSGSEPVSGHGILGIEGSLNGQTFACPGSSCNVSLNEGTNNFTYWALSSWGDSSTMGTVTAKVDSRPPDVNGSFSGTLGSNGWYIAPVSFMGTASDATSGLASFTCSLDGIAFPSCSPINVSTEGAHTIVLTARDNAGNELLYTRNTSLDTQTPVLTASVSGTMGSNNWYTTAAFNASASDAMPGSGLAAFEYNLDNYGWMAFPVSGTLDLPEGHHNVDIRALDHAGHTVSASKSFWLDSAAPGITLNPAGTLGANNWYTTDLTLAASSNDSVSGIDIFEYSLNNSVWTAYTTPLTLSDGAHNASFWAQDQAGLVTQVDRIYQVDTRSPQIAGSMNGTPGANGWYVSDVILSASAADPLPGSGMETFAYILNGAAETPFTDAVTLKDGQHLIRLDAQDKAGLAYFIEQTVKVDTVRPSLIVDTVLPSWIKDGVVLSGTAVDNGSGLSKVEISTDGGQTWQGVTGSTAWNHEWDTHTSLNGSHNVHVRVTDKAGLTTEKIVNTGVDNHAPNISMPGSWYQWDTISLDVWDNHSGLAEVQIEISDPEGRWQKREIQLDPGQFPLNFKWDRRFGDNTVAPLGTYDVKVIAFDNLGNSSREAASVKILLGILPAGPTATPQPYSRNEFTPTPAYTAASIPSPTATQITVISVFGGMEPFTPATSTPSTVLVPRATPTQTTVRDWLESVFMPNSSSDVNVTQIGFLDESKEIPNPVSESNSSVLWGATAVAMAGAVTAYALEEKRKQQAEKAAQAANKADEEERRAKAQVRQTEKMDAKRAQEKAWEEARSQKDFATGGMNAKLDRDDDQEGAIWAVSQMEIRKRYEDKKRAEEEKKKAEELKAGLAAYYSATKQGQVTTSASEPTWLQKTWDSAKNVANKTIEWVDQHQTEIALGIGVAVGVGAIVLSGGIATPMVAAAWTAGATALAVGTVAAGTVALNKHYGRDWNENLLPNVALAGAAALVVTGGWFLFQTASTSLGAYCVVNPVICSRVDPIFKTIDAVEETWLNVKLTYQTWRGDEAGAVDTAFEIHSEHMDGGMPGNSLSKELREQLAELGQDAVNLVRKHGTEIVPLLAKYGDDGLEIIQKYGDDGVALLKKYGDDATDLLKTVDLKSAEKLLGTLDSDVLDYAKQQGPDALTALSHWSEKDLKEHGIELALRAKKDAEVLADVKKLAISGPIDPKHLTQEQQTLINAIAANSTHYAKEGQVVLGKWVDISNGFVEQARDTGSVHYNPHPDMWDMFGELGAENQGQVAWLINKQVVQTGINKGLPFEYTLKGIPDDNLDNELAAVRAIFSGKTEAEIVEILELNRMPIRMKELQELQKAGYEFTFDNVNNSYIFSQP